MLILYATATALLLGYLSRGRFSAITSVSTVAVFALSAMAALNSIRLVDHKTIANFRRTVSVILAGALLMLICAVVGAADQLFTGSQSAETNSLIFGGLSSFGFEFLVFKGAFTENTPLSFIAAALHPASTLAVLRIPELAFPSDPFPYVFGILAAIVIGFFPFLLGSRKTSRGFTSIGLFQAFMKTWAGGSPSELETMISEHAETTELTTKLIRFQGGNTDVYVVLPGVHPGPFHPVGSYNLPGAIVKAFSGLGPVLTLHRPGGHERNLTTGRDTTDYATLLSEFAQEIQITGTTIKGPIHSTIGKAKVAAIGLDRDVLVTLTFSPLGSDDLDAEVETKLEAFFKSSGMDASIIDAHNSLDHNQLSPEMDSVGWESLFGQVKRTKAAEFKVAYSSSRETGFKHGMDMTENGLSMLMLEVGGSKHVLVLADANNAIPPLRGEVENSLAKAGYTLIEFCTSDSHDLAARGLTVQRGYQALGEATNPDSIVRATIEMARLAESRLSQGRYGSGRLTKELRVFGSNALDEFAAIAKASSKLGRSYLRFTVFSIALLLLGSVVF